MTTDKEIELSERLIRVETKLDQIIKSQTEINQQEQAQWDRIDDNSKMITVLSESIVRLETKITTWIATVVFVAPIVGVVAIKIFEKVFP